MLVYARPKIVMVNSDTERAFERARVAVEVIISPGIGSRGLCIRSRISSFGDIVAHEDEGFY